MGKYYFYLHNGSNMDNLNNIEYAKVIRLHNQHSIADKFCRESNYIEGEERELTEDELKAAVWVINNTIVKEGDLNLLHKLCTSYEHKKDKPAWIGRYRTIQVYVGSYVPPAPEEVPELMAKFIRRLPDMHPWEAHNEFEKIHPYEDYNGRMGRLIWLSKMYKAGYRYKIPFLHMYYYQTLERYDVV